MFEDQTVELLPARTTMRVNRGGRGGNGGRGGDALAISAAVLVINRSDVDARDISVTSGDASATGGAGGAGGAGGRAG